MKFREYVSRRLVEDLDINSLRSMILRAIGGNSDNPEAYNTPLNQFVPPEELEDRLNSLKPLEQLVSSNPAAIQAIQKIGEQGNDLTVGELAALLLYGSENKDFNQ